MAFSFIGAAQAVVTTTPGSTSGIDTTGADIAVVSLSQWYGATAGNMADNKGNTFIPIASQISPEVLIQTWYMRGGSFGPDHTFGPTSGGSIYSVVSVLVFSGSQASPLDTFTTSWDDGGTVLSTGSIIPAQDNELIVTSLAVGAFESPPIAIDSGYSLPVAGVDYSGGVNEGGAIAYLIQTSLAATNPQWSWGSESNGNATIIASFKTGGAAAMLTSDIVSPVSFQGGMARDEANGIEWLSQGFTDRGVPGEWGISSLRDITAPSEWLSGWSTDRGTLGEWLSAPLRDIVTPNEALSHASIDGYLTGEWTGLAFMDIGVPTESLAQVVIDRGVPGGWLGSSLLTSVVSVDFISALVGESLAPVEYEGEILFVSEGAVPIEWLGSFLLDRGLPIEAVLEAAADRRTRMEWLAPAILDTALPGEFTVSLAGDRFVPIEFEGNLLLISDRILPIEWSGLPVIARVSLERLLASPSKRRVLGTPGRLRLLKRQ
jgi:hypothetical protein